jgi:integral membrane protein (TIGR01906 family)
VNARTVATRVAVIAIAIAVPPLLVTSALRIVANDWIVSFEYDHGRVPADGYGLTRDQRAELALVGLDSIMPGGRGIDLLRDAELPDGEPAFNARELTHMQDVRDIVGVLFTVQLVLLVALAAVSLALAFSPATRTIAPRGVRAGALATLGLAAAVGLLMLLAWNGFFERFHGIFFEGDTWRFRDTDTLRRLYPDEFWMGVGAWIAGLTVLLALVLAGATVYWLRRVRPGPGRT